MLVNTSQRLLVPIDSCKQIALSINQFFKFLVELLWVRSNVLHTAWLHMFLDLIPVFAVEAQGFQKEIMLISWPPADFILVLNLLCVFLFCRTQRISVLRVIVQTRVHTLVRVASFGIALQDLIICVRRWLGRFRLNPKYLAWWLLTAIDFARFLFVDLNLQWHCFTSYLF